MKTITEKEIDDKINSITQMRNDIEKRIINAHRCGNTPDSIDLRLTLQMTSQIEILKSTIGQDQAY